MKQPCADTTQCIDANPCTTDSCDVDGFCAHAPFGKGEPPQIDGDCKHVTCNGTTEIAEDDPDDEDDGNACTDDACQGGEAVHSPTPAGGRCAIGPLSGKCDGEGSCLVACETDAQCNDGNDCTDDGCNLSTKTCMNAPQNGIHRGAPNAPGDCKIPACVDGAPEDVADTTDVPSDGKECTVDSCTAARPTFTPQPEGTSCSAGQCTAAGDCTGCVANSFCGDDTACSKPVCQSGTCDPGYDPFGTPVSDASQQDCFDTVCDGTGNPTLVPDDSETPDDGIDCTAQACVAGVETTAFQPDTTPCDDDGGALCLQGACVECIDTTDCAANQVCAGTQCCETCASLGKTCGSWPDGCNGTLNCNNGVVDLGETDIDCGNVMGCKCPNGKLCGVDDDACLSGMCRDGYCCNQGCTNICRACNSVLTGAPNGTCANIIKGLQDPSTCNGANACNGNMGNGSCVNKYANGTPCGDDSECASSVCTAGLCCNAICDTNCKSCLAAETGLPVNVCGNVLVDTDPQDDCGSNDCCNGSGFCYDGPGNCN